MGRRQPHPTTEGTRTLGEPMRMEMPVENLSLSFKQKLRDGNSGGSMPDPGKAKAERRRRTKQARAARRRNR